MINLRMVLETQELGESVEALRQKLQEAEDSLHRLAQVEKYFILYGTYILSMNY